MANNIYDAIVVGSGITGGWAAKELCEKGLKVLLLERGKNIEHIKDYVNANKEAWDYPNHGTPTNELKQQYPVLSRDGRIFTQETIDMWANEQDNPYTETKRFDWYRGYQVGGRSLTWGRQTYRFNQWDFEANAKEGIGTDWPIRYKDIEPWYSYVEQFAGIQGSLENLDVLPDGHFLPPMPLTCVEKDLAARLKEKYNNTRHLIIGRSANLTQALPQQQRSQCQYRDKCWLGCMFGGYFSTQSATLPAAQKTGNLTLRPFSIAKEILYDKDKKRAKGVEIIDAENNQTYQYLAKIIFVCASTFNSTWLLMNSATHIWGNGLGSSSGELGHNVMDHHFKVGARGMVEGFKDKYIFGRRPTGIYIPRFRNIYNDKRNYLRGFGYQGDSWRKRGDAEAAKTLIGAELKEIMSYPTNWYFGINGYGEFLPYHQNKISLNKNKKDKWGLPVLDIDVSLQVNELAMRKDMKDDAAEMLEAIGIKNITAFDKPYFPGMAIHEMGTARMGTQPNNSVLNKYNQVWDAPNVFVTDGACMTSSSCVNPSLTYMALTARAANYAVAELKKQNL